MEVYGPVPAPGPGRPGGAGLAPPASLHIPIYRQAEAARILGIPRSTLRYWAAGGAAGLVTVTRPAGRGGPSVPFTGLAEAFVLASLRRAGVPMQRIRAGVARLRAELGVHPVLASDRLRAAGGELLWLDADGGLAEARSGQLVLREAIEDSLGRVSYDAGGWARAITIRRGDSELVVDPLVNGGRPAPAPAEGRPGG
jgi:Bacterial regulatory protein, Fis family